MQLVTIAMEALFIVILSIEQLGIGAQKVTTVLQKAHTQQHAHQELMLTLNTTSLRTIVSRAFPVCSAQRLDLITPVEIVLRDSTVQQEKPSKVLQTRNVNLVIIALRVADFTIHALLGLISHTRGKVFATPAQLAATVIQMKLDKTCHVKEMALVELLHHLIALQDISAPMVPNGPSSIHVLSEPLVM